MGVCKAITEEINKLSNQLRLVQQQTMDFWLESIKAHHQLLFRLGRKKLLILGHLALIHTEIIMLHKSFKLTIQTNSLRLNRGSLVEEGKEYNLKKKVKVKDKDKGHQGNQAKKKFQLREIRSLINLDFATSYLKISILTQIRISHLWGKIRDEAQVHLEVWVWKVALDIGRVMVQCLWRKAGLPTLEALAI